MADERFSNVVDKNIESTEARAQSLARATHGYNFPQRTALRVGFPMF